MKKIICIIFIVGACFSCAPANTNYRAPIDADAYNLLINRGKTVQYVAAYHDPLYGHCITFLYTDGTRFTIKAGKYHLRIVE